MAPTQADSTWTAPVKGGAGTWAAGWGEALDIEFARLTVWSPALLVLGIWGYFALEREPPALLVWPCILLCIALLVWGHRHRTLKVMALLLLGFSAAQARTQWVSTPLLRAFSPNQSVIGYVADVDVRSRLRFTMILEIEAAPKLPNDEKPRRIHLSITGKHIPPKVGDLLNVTADLAPLPRPSQPGVFDYGRQLFFQSIGAVGRSKLTPVIIESDVPWRFNVRRAFHNLRSAIGTRIRSAIPGPLGSFADALITGERASIPRDMNTSLQASGLFHILSISGLHMALVAGGAFWVVRAGLALFPNVALRWPIKKWAAGCAIFVGLIYMLLANSGAATERSFIMIAVVFFAVLVDRPALSLQNLAIAALLILLREPEQALAASFQMSFMAVMGLAAFFVWWQRVFPVKENAHNQPRFERFGRRMLMLIAVSLATSLVAGALSSIPAAHHFGRLAPYGVVANALALPVVSIVVMPAAMASVLLMPLGLEGLPLQLMGWGLKLVMVISDWVASWPAAGLQLKRMSELPAAALAFGTALLVLPVTKLRWACLPFFVVATVLLFRGEDRPILLIDERAGNVALWTDQGLVPALPKSATASVSRWLTHAGDADGFKNALARPGWTCVAGLCTAQSGQLKLGFILKQVVVTPHCPRVDILVSQEPLRRRCKGKLATIDRFDVWRNGAHAVYASGEIENTSGYQGKRPWVYAPRARTKP